MLDVPSLRADTPEVANVVHFNRRLARDMARHRVEDRSRRQSGARVVAGRRR
jgi:hypothetical protein